MAVLDTAGRVVRLNYPCMQLTGPQAWPTPLVTFPLSMKCWTMSTGCGPRASCAKPHRGRFQDPQRDGLLEGMAGGKSRRVGWTLRPLAGPNEEVQYLIVTGQDVTDQREVEKALLSSETRYRQVVENSLGFLFTCSLEGRLTLAQCLHRREPWLSN